MNSPLRFDIVFNNWSVITSGISLTLQLTGIAVLLSTLLGILVAFINMRGNKATRLIISGYIEIMRNVPLLVVLYFIYFGLGEVSIDIGSFMSVILALVLCNGAYIAEIFRAGIESIPKAQSEAGEALGLHSYQVFFRIIIPQAFIDVFPNLINQYIILMLSTSFASLVAVDELTSTVSRLSSFTFHTFEFYIVGTLIYFVFTLIIAFAARKIEKKLRRTTKKLVLKKVKT